MDKTTYRKATAVAAALALAMACAFALAACSGNGSGSSAKPITGVELEHDSVAVTVNGHEIMESEIVYEIQGARAMYGMEDEETWGKALAEQGLTPAEIRQNYIDAMVEDYLVNEKGAKDLGIEVTDEEVDKAYDDMVANYDTEEAWQAALSDSGMTADEYKQTLRDNLLGKKLNAHFEETTETSDEAMKIALESFAEHYNGSKRSSHILIKVDDVTDEAKMQEAREKAQKALDEINAGRDFGDVAKEYSDDTSASADGDVGWDTAGAFVGPYQAALDKLDVNEVSGLVETEYGVHVIKCTAIADYGDPKTITIDDVPGEYRQSVEALAQVTSVNDAYMKWIEDLKAAATIEIADMPEGLPYDVDMAKYASEVEDGAGSPTVFSVDEEGNATMLDDGAAASGSSSESK